MDAQKILARYFSTLALPLILEHGLAVAAKALEIARNSGKAGDLDLQFIEEAAILHDIGVSATNAPYLDCHGSAPYICHGIIGREILEKEGLPRHALVCERHIGVGLTVDDIRIQQLPLPLRDMVPLTPEEKIIACADLFFSKNKAQLANCKTMDEIRNSLAKFGDEKVAVFNTWVEQFRL